MHPSAAPAASQARPRPAHPPILDNGFRPFFLGGAAWVVVALALWVGLLGGAIPSFGVFDPLAWHQHELLFGAVGAIVTGFVLTAIPNWTGGLPVRGWPLAALFGLWAFARLGNLTSGAVGAWPAAAVEALFLLSLPVLALREIVKGKNWRNLPVCSLTGLFALGGILSHLEPAAGLAETAAIGRRLGLSVVLALIGLIGGRVVPSFTRNWLAKQGAPPQHLPASFSTFDKAALAVLVLSLAVYTARLGLAAGLLMAAAGALQLARMARWRGHRTLREPLVAVLHLAYAWLGVGLVLLGLALAGWLLQPSAAIHALTTGAIGTMTLAMMTRASLGHTGRALRADAATLAIYASVTLGAATRLAAGGGAGDPLVWYGTSAALWGGAYALFCAAYGPKLLASRVGSGPAKASTARSGR